MRPLLGYIALATVVVAAAPASLLGQDSTSAQKREAATVLDYTFNSPRGEPVRVFLAKGQSYRAEVQGKGLTLELHPLLSSVQAPRVLPVLGSRAGSASGESLYAITPHADAEYVFTTVGGALTEPVRLRVYSVEAAARKRSSK